MAETTETSPSTTRARRRAARLAARLVRAQTEHPWLVLLGVLLTVALAGLATSRLTLKTSFGELLPQNKDSVVVAERVSQRLVSASTLVIVAQGEDKQALQRFVDALGPEIRALGPSLVGAVDDGVRASRQFFEQNQVLYAPLADVQQVHDEILERYDYEVAKVTGSALELDDDAPPPLTAESVKQRLTDRGKATTKPKPDDPQYPDGYYMEPDGRMIALLVRTGVSSGDIDRANTFMKRIEEIVARVDPKRFDPQMRIYYTGNFITAAEEYQQIKGDLADVGLRGVLMILGVVFLFYLRVRTVLLMALCVAVGAIWSFGLAWLTVGHLNSSTGFLVSIIVGNGINFGIIYMARYMEARRVAGVGAALYLAHRDTWMSTLAAAGAGMVSYGSLMITDFRGFKHFGIIGGSGMMLCWLATYLCLPALLAASEHIRPIKPEGGLASRLRAGFGRPLAWLTTRFPRTLMAVGVSTGIAALAITVHYIVSDPMEYDLSNTRNKPVAVESNARLLMRRVDKIVGRLGQDGVAILVDRLDQIAPLKAALEARRDAAPADAKPFARVVTIYDLLPTEQDKKLALVDEARDRLQRARKRGLISEADWTDLEKHLPAAGKKPLGIDDLPEQVARSFVEKDGTRGRLVYIVPTSGRSVWDAHYLMEWADSFRSTTLPDGSVVKGSGSSVIFADMIVAVLEDVPKAIIASVLGTLAVILFAFRARRASWAVIGVLLLGLCWMMAVLALWGSKLTWAGGMPHFELVGLKINFLNFVALPVSIGVGADYAVNVMERYRIEGRGSAAFVIIETGGAVVLCSLTTVLGYFALTSSVNKAIISFGIASAAGELACLMAAVVVLPAFLVWRDRHVRWTPPSATSGEPPAAPAAPDAGEAPAAPAAVAGAGEAPAEARASDSTTSSAAAATTTDASA
jgi:predicted RND superfamily exporter protein